MDISNLKYQVWRIFRMARYKGLFYTLAYIKTLAFYNSNFFYEKILSKFPPDIFYPRFIEVEVTTRCPLKCIMCEHTFWQEKSQDMTLAQLKGIVEQFPRLKWIGLTGIGSSFVNPDFLAMIKYVKGRKLYLELYDTFFLINGWAAKTLVETGVDRMIVSIDAATKKTYEKIRVNANFDTVIKNIKRLQEIKKWSKSPYPEIVFHYVICKLNLGEVLPFIDLVKKLSGGEKTSILFSGILHNFPEISHLWVEITDNLTKKANKKGEELGIRITWNRNVPTQREPIQKCNEWLMPFIFVDGTVIPCCATNEANLRDFQRKTSMGNVFRTPFKRIWEGEKYQNLRQMIREGKIPPACRICTNYEVGKG